jgi:hypothetical protein
MSNLKPLDVPSINAALRDAEKSIIKARGDLGSSCPNLALEHLRCALSVVTLAMQAIQRSS